MTVPLCGVTNIQMRLRAFSSLLVATFVLTFKVTANDPFDQSRVPLEADTADTNLAKIVLLAGSPSNKPGQHEYFAGCALFSQWLRQTPGVWPVMARDGWPKNEKIFDGAKSVVIFMDGGTKQTFLEPARWARLQKLLADGAGLVMLHQAVDYPLGPDKEMKEWLGGVWLRDIGCRGHWDMEMRPQGDHPILRGVKAFPVKGDGWLYNLHFASDSKKFTPLLAGPVPENSRTTAAAKKHAGRDELMGWCFERANGGRSFGFTGADLHANWALADQRRFVLNGILWTARHDIPADGARAEFTPEDLKVNLDDKRATDAK